MINSGTELKLDLPSREGRKPFRLEKLVPERGLEPPLPCENCDLNAARLPIPPFGHECGTTRHFYCAERSGLCQRNPANREVGVLENLAVAKA